MAALVVVDVSRALDMAHDSARLDIFPGGATPTVFPAGTPFWIGYGFALDAGAPGDGDPVGETTRFELDVDGAAATLESDERVEDAVVSRKTQLVDFLEGLPPGWHSFHGRWYDAGRLLLSNRVSIEFVEP
jgi:hypothetical protein